jgi:defect-in-organelle-trafficking protein DotC
MAVQAGARWRYQEIVEDIIKPREELLDQLFDFESLVSKNGPVVMIPPVATQAGQAVRLKDSQTALGQDGSYSLISKARLATVKPDWRHYLLKIPQGPGEIHETLKPKGFKELQRWRKQFDRGWAQGLAQADRLFASNVATLSRDYVGMMIFKRLILERYAREAGTSETITDLEVGESEIVFRKTLYQLVGQDSFVDPGRKKAEPK